MAILLGFIHILSYNYSGIRYNYYMIIKGLKMSSKNLSKKQKEVLAILKENGIMLRYDERLNNYNKEKIAPSTISTLITRGFILKTIVDGKKAIELKV